MKAIIQVDVPDFQIGQEVSVYFKDTMMIKGVCEEGEVIRCKNCKHYDYCFIRRPHLGNWFCADGEKMEVNKE